MDTSAVFDDTFSSVVASVFGVTFFAEFARIFGVVNLEILLRIRLFISVLVSSFFPLLAWGQKSQFHRVRFRSNRSFIRGYL